jgi:hypothetical protein
MLHDPIAHTKVTPDKGQHQWERGDIHIQTQGYRLTDQHDAQPLQSLRD